MRIIIPGKPIAKKRPRFARRGKFVTTYNDQQTEEGRFLFEVQKQYTGRPLEGPVTLFLKFYMPRPKSHFGTGKNDSTLKQSAPKHHTIKPDIDNLEKFVFDCLNGVAWVDDCQIDRCFKTKTYSDNPRTEIVIFG